MVVYLTKNIRNKLTQYFEARQGRSKDVIPVTQEGVIEAVTEAASKKTTTNSNGGIIRNLVLKPVGFKLSQYFEYGNRSGWYLGEVMDIWFCRGGSSPWCCYMLKYIDDGDEEPWYRYDNEEILNMQHQHLFIWIELGHNKPKTNTPSVSTMYLEPSSNQLKSDFYPAVQRPLPNNKDVLTAAFLKRYDNISKLEEYSNQLQKYWCFD